MRVFKQICATIGCTLALCGVVSAEAVTPEILQYRLERLYFSAGTESLVFPGCRFVVMRDDAAVAEGVIESALPGVAVSEAGVTLSDTIGLSEYTVTVDTYRVDSTSSIAIGQAIGPWFDLAIAPVRDTGAVNRVTVDSYGFGDRARERMLFDFERGMLHGCFSYRAPVVSGERVQHVSAAAPWMVVLVPNVSREVNRQGFLTTALYYSFDSGKLPLLFNGTNLRAVTSFVPAVQSSRPYPYDQTASGELLSRILGPNGAVTIGITDPSLRRTAGYFADILGREGVRTSVSNDLDESDCYLAFAPYDLYNDGYTLRYITRRLHEQFAESASVYEGLAIARSHLEQARNRADSSSRVGLLRMVNTRLIEDIGVFPLFRPTIHGVFAAPVTDIAVDQFDRFTMHQLSLLIPPPYMRDGAQ